MSFYANAARSLGAVAKTVGRSLEAAGVGIEGPNAVVERLQPATRLIPHRSQVPKVAGSTFVAPTASLIGDVTLGQGSSVWYGAVVRGDIHYVKIGAGSSIGDGAVVHVAKFAGDLPAVIGANVHVGAKATVHACTVEDGATIGAGATVLDGAKVSKGAILAAGSLAPPRAVIPPNQVWAGAPAVYVRDVTAADASAAKAALAESLRLAAAHAAEAAKSSAVLLDDEAAAEDAFQRDPEIHKKPQVVQPGHTLHDPDEVDGIATPGRIFNNALRHPAEELDEYSEAGVARGAAAFARARESRRLSMEEQAALTEGSKHFPRP